MTLGSPPSMTATTELVVPRSIPIIFAMETAPPLEPTSACWEIGVLCYDNTLTIEVECIIVKFIDDGRRQLVAQKMLRSRPLESMS
jgi:hypothetical protein